MPEQGDSRLIEELEEAMRPVELYEKHRITIAVAEALSIFSSFSPTVLPICRWETLKSSGVPKSQNRGFLSLSGLLVFVGISGCGGDAGGGRGGVKGGEEEAFLGVREASVGVEQALLVGGKAVGGGPDLAGKHVQEVLVQCLSDEIRLFDVGEGVVVCARPVPKR